jgi:hypothetical protein
MNRALIESRLALAERNLALAERQVADSRERILRQNEIIAHLVSRAGTYSNCEDGVGFASIAAR